MAAVLEAFDFMPLFLTALGPEPEAAVSRLVRLWDASSPLRLQGSRYASQYRLRSESDEALVGEIIAAAGR